MCLSICEAKCLDVLPVNLIAVASCCEESVQKKRLCRSVLDIETAHIVAEICCCAAPTALHNIL